MLTHCSHCIGYVRLCSEHCIHDAPNGTLVRYILHLVSLFLGCRGHVRSEEHTSELQSHSDLVCRLLLEKKNNNTRKGKPEPCDPRQQEPYDQYHENSHVKHSDYHKMALLSRQPT